MTKIKNDPFIWVKDDAVPQELCQRLITKFDQSPNARPGITAVGYENIKQSLDLYLTNESEFAEENTDIFNLIGPLLVEYRTQLPFVPWNGGVGDTGYNIQMTRPGQFYDWHDDHLSSVQPPLVRTVTFILYLNTVNKGGHTEFWTGKKVKPKEGRALLFPAEFTYRHRGCTPKSNNKYICTGWFHEPLPLPANS
jgi:hypothetical protein